MSRQKPILEVNENASLAEINKAYRAAALRLHPDKGGSEEEMKQLNSEVEILRKAKVKPNDITNRHSSSVKPRNDNGSLFTEPKSTKKEKVTQYYNVTKFNIKFSPTSSNEQRVFAVFTGMQNMFGFSMKAKINDKKTLHSGSETIGHVTFLGTLLNKFSRTVTSTNAEETKKLESSRKLRLK